MCQDCGEAAAQERENGMETIAFMIVVAGLLSLGIYVLMSFAKDDQEEQSEQ
jgi:hypothetical protein